jgi:hypothetical protein
VSGILSLGFGFDSALRREETEGAALEDEAEMVQQLDLGGQRRAARWRWIDCEEGDEGHVGPGWAISANWAERRLGWEQWKREKKENQVRLPGPLGRIQEGKHRAAEFDFWISVQGLSSN